MQSIKRLCFITDMPKTQYCLDYTINYCSGILSPSIKPIINDPNLKPTSASTIFGTGKEDSEGSKALKQFGYPIGIFFLVFTLACFILDDDLTKVIVVYNINGCFTINFTHTTYKILIWHYFVVIILPGAAWKNGDLYRRVPLVCLHITSNFNGWAIPWQRRLLRRLNIRFFLCHKR